MKKFSLFVPVWSALVSAAPAALGQHEPRAACFVGDARVLEWNAIAADVIGAAPPVNGGRFLAITQLAVFEAVNAITAEYEPYLGTIDAPPGASAEAAAIAAAHGVLEGYFPAASAALDRRLVESLDTLVDDQARADGVTVGEEAAALMLAERVGDGSEAPQFYLPPDRVPGGWQPTAGCGAAGGAFRHWQAVEPFGIENASQFRAAPPFPLTSRRYARDLEEVKTLGSASSSERPQDRADVASLYAAQPAPIGWNSVARQLASARLDDITQTARTLALLNVAINDSLIAVFESKYYYAVWRPETAITRANEDGNPRTDADAVFTPFIVAPCFPSYPSGHGTVAGAASSVLIDAYGEGGHEFTNSSAAVPGVVLHYERLAQMVHDVSDARVYGGIHFRNDQDAAQTLGSAVAAYELEHLLQKVGGEGRHE